MRTDAYALPEHPPLHPSRQQPDLLPHFSGRHANHDDLRPAARKEKIPRDLMRQSAEEEAPHFLWTFLNVKLPPPEGRATAAGHRDRQESSVPRTLNRSVLEEFIADSPSHPRCEGFSSRSSTNVLQLAQPGGTRPMEEAANR